MPRQPCSKTSSPWDPYARSLRISITTAWHPIERSSPMLSTFSCVLACEVQTHGTCQGHMFENRVIKVVVALLSRNRSVDVSPAHEVGG